ncbi:MAG: hypothetical protein Q3966_09560 [Neisseria sp.]|nr:hypothetical protein [Neisseria sp.]
MNINKTPALLPAICLFLLALPAAAQGIKTSRQAVSQVIKSVEKHKLTTLKTECLMFVDEETAKSYLVDVREKHDEQCGGDPQTAPRLFSYEIDKRSGKMKTDAPAPDAEWTGEYRDID